MAVRVVGIGNEGAGDDGVGPAIVRALRERQVDAAVVDVAGLIDALREPGRVVLVDALLGAQPGRVHHLTEQDLIGALQPISSHALSVEQAIGVARALTPHGATLELIGVEVGPPRQGLGLSEAVARAVPEAVAAVEHLIAR